MIGGCGGGYSQRPMRLRIVLVLLFGALALVAAGCGGGEDAAPLPEEVEGDVPAETEPAETDAEEPAGEEPDNGAAGEDGEQIFASAGCGGCHTFADAGTSGTVGPNLDESDLSEDEAYTIIHDGQGAMPAFGNQLSEQQIRAVAAYVTGS